MAGQYLSTNASDITEFKQYHRKVISRAYKQRCYQFGLSNALLEGLAVRLMVRVDRKDFISSCGVILASVASFNLWRNFICWAAISIVAIQLNRTTIAYLSRCSQWSEPWHYPVSRLGPQLLVYSFNHHSLNALNAVIFNFMVRIPFIFFIPIFYSFDQKISTVLALLGGETTTEPVLTPARILNLTINQSLIQVPILDDLLEDAPHARTGKVYVDGFAFKAYYHATSDSHSGDRGVAVIFQTSLQDGSLHPITAGTVVTNRALNMWATCACAHIFLY